MMMKKLINLIALVMIVSVNVLTPFSYAKNDQVVSGIIEYNREGEYIELRYNNQKIRIRDKNVGATKVAVNDYIFLYNLGREYYDNLGYNPCGVVPIKGSMLNDEYYEAEFLARAQELLGRSEPLTCDDVEEIKIFYNSETYNPYEDTDYLASFGNYYFRGNNTGAKREDLNVNLNNRKVSVNPEVIEKGFNRGKLGEEDTGWEKGNVANPCNAASGEYLPTSDDWKKLMQMRGGIRGYEVIYHMSLAEEGPTDFYKFNEVEAMGKFTQDIRIPEAGVVKGTTIQTGRSLWTAKDGNQIGYLNLYDGLGIFGITLDRDNTIAMPVRCFMYINMAKVEFDTDGGNDVESYEVEEGTTITSPKTPTRTGYTFEGWYKDDEFTQEWNFDEDIVSGNMTLYAKRQECEEGYEVVKNQCVAEGSAGVKYENGLIKISDGKDTVYLKDRNEGNINDEMVDDYRFILNVEVIAGGLLVDEFEEQCDYVEECVEEKALEYIEKKTGKHFDSEERVMEYIETLNEKYEGGLDNLLDEIVGNFYFRGNNTGVSLDKLVIENGKIMNKSELVQKGFDGGKIGDMDGSGWIEGNYNNPCDWSKGEYLPTPDDWKNLFGVWGNLNDYNMEEFPFGSRDDVNFVGVHSIYDFALDMLISPVPYIIYENEMELIQGYPLMSWNGQDKIGEVGITLTDYDYIGVAHSNPENVSEGLVNEINSIALPVRCFVKVPVVKFETKGGSSMNDMEVFKGDKIVIKNQPTKLNATFDGWYKDAGLTEKWDFENDLVEDDMILYAKWIENKPSGGSSGGGGGGGGSSKTSNDEKDTKQSTGSQADSSEKSPQNYDSVSSGAIAKNPVSETSMDSPTDKSASEGQEIISPSDSSFTKEQKEAYEFAKEKGITTMSTIQKAKMNSPLTRIAMAKMLSQYAINVLGQTPDTSKTIKFKDVTSKKDVDYDNGVTLAYQLGIMGQNMPNNNFRPNDEVTRAEFVTALSRMIYGTSDGEYKSTPKYYTNHMEKLEEEKIITKTDPKMKELRGYVMIMLMRSAK